ncbi:MAG: helix-turn-helix domain-containing protein [Armatimonadota bacterium]
MHSLFQYIENHLSADLDTELLSSVGYASHAKLYRVFYDLTGHSVKEYVRKRRLSNALALIKTSDMGLTDIAVQCGYSSHQALCRAVREKLGVTPSAYKHGSTYYFFPPFNGEPLHSVTVANETIPPTLRILFYHSRLKNIENMAVNTFLTAVPDYGGRIFGRNGKQKGNRLCYELYLTDIESDHTRLVQSGFEIAGVTPGSTATFATSLVRNDEQQINTAWYYLYAEWLQGSMFHYTDEPYYEEYLLHNGKPVKLKLYLPIHKRDEDTKITLTANPELRFITAKARGYNAERIASQTVIDYLTRHYPYLMKSSTALYLQKDADTYVCGVRVHRELQTIEDKHIMSIHTDRSHHLVLESRVMGDYDRYAEMLLSFARDNGMTVITKGIFAVYNAKESFDNLGIKMYCPVKFDTK